MRSTSPWLPALLISLVGGCAALGSPIEDDSLLIVAPADGAFLADGEVTVRGTTDLAGVSEVRINGRFVPVEGGSFETTLELAEGPARITAAVEGHEAAVAVTVDTTDPVVIIESPEAGTFSDAQRLHVRGRVDDRNADSVTLNGEEIELADDGRFDHIWDVAPGAHRIRVEATDRAGRSGRSWTSVLWGDFQSTDAPHLDAMILDIGGDALSNLADGVEPFLASENLEPLLARANPVVDGFWGRLDIEGESHAPADLALVPREGHLQIALAIPSVHVPVRADLRVGGDITGDVTVGRAFVTGQLHVAAAHGLPVITVSDVEVSLEGLHIDVHGLGSFIDEHVVTRAAKSRLEGQIHAMIVDQVPARLGEALEELSQFREIDFADGTVVVESSIVALRASREGLSATVDMGLSATAALPELEERALGSFVAGGETPGRNGDANVHAAVSADLINDALHTAWLTGALSRSFPRFEVRGAPISVATIALLVPGVGADLPGDSLVQLTIDAVLPPVVGPTDEGLLAADLVDLRVSAFAEVDGALVPLFSASVGVHAAAEVDLSGAAVAFSLPELEVVGDLVEGPASAPDGEELDALLTSIVGPMVDDLLAPISLDIPSLGGFSLDAPAADYESGYLTFSADLTYGE